jgi:hypothetical protein
MTMLCTLLKKTLAKSKEVKAGRSNSFEQTNLAESSEEGCG